MACEIYAGHPAHCGGAEGGFGGWLGRALSYRHVACCTTDKPFLKETIMATQFRRLLAVLLVLVMAASVNGCGLMSFGAGAATGAVVEDEVDDDEED
jgi:hypothetical protein